jgi:hypothetical protein
LIAAGREIVTTVRGDRRQAFHSIAWRAARAEERLVSQTFASWNRPADWLTRIDALRQAAWPAKSMN